MAAGPGPKLDEHAAGARDPYFAGFIVLASLDALVLAAAAWSVPRGVSFVDEGYFLADVRDPAEWVSLWAQMVHALFAWTGLDLVALRWINVAGLGAVSAWFAHRAGDWLGAEGALPAGSRWAPRAVAAFVFAGSLLRLATFPLAASYNTVNQSLLLAALGTLLAARSARLRGGAAAWGRPLVLGSFLCLQLFVKAPSAVATALVVLPVWAVLVSADARGRIRDALLATAGAAAAAALVLSTLTSPSAWIGVVTRIAPEFQRVDPDHGLARVAARFPGELAEGVLTTALHYRWFLVPAIACLAFAAVRRRRGRPLATTWIVIVSVALTALFVARFIWLGHPAAPLRGTVQPYVALLLFAIAALAILRPGPLARTRGAAALTLMLIVASLAGVFGSNRHWMMYWPLYATPCFVAAAAVCAGLGRGPCPITAAPLLLCGVAAIATVQSVVGMVATPMGLAPRWRQTEMLEGFAALDGVRVDPATNRYLTGLRDLAAPAAAGTARRDAVGIYCVEMEQAALGFRPLAGVWGLFYLSEPAAVASALRRELPSGGARPVVISHARGDANGADETLRRLGIGFPERYELRGGVEHPTTRRRVQVYFPRE